MITNDKEKTFGYGILCRIMGVLGTLFMSILFLANFQRLPLNETYKPFEPYIGAAIFLTGIIIFVHRFVISFQRVHISPNDLVISKLGSRVTLPLKEITAVTLTLHYIIITTQDKTYRIATYSHKNCRYDKLQLYQALQQYVPMERIAHVPQLTAPLPIIVKPHRVAKTSVSNHFLLGIVMFLTGAGLLWYVTTHFADLDWAKRIFLLLAGPFFAGVGGLTFYMFLWRFVWRYTFTSEVVQLRRALAIQTYPVSEIVTMGIKSKERKLSGVVRTSYTLNLEMRNGRSIIISPNGGNLQFNYVEIEDKLILIELEQQLKHHWMLG